jgi:hypothetical protein
MPKTTKAAAAVAAATCPIERSGHALFSGLLLGLRLLCTQHMTERELLLLLL